MKQKYSFRKILPVVVLYSLLSVLFCIPVSAKGKLTCETSHAVYTSETGYFALTDLIFIKNSTTKNKIINIISENKIIVGTADVYGNQLVVKLRVSPRAQNGSSSELTIMIKDGSEIVSLKCRVTVKKAAPFSKVAISGKNIASATANSNGMYLFGEEFPGNACVKAGKGQTIQLKPRANTVIINILYISQNTVKQIKNGSTLNLKKGDQIIVSYYRLPVNVSADTSICENVTEGYFGIRVI